MDVCKIASNLYQYTAIDDCTRYKILALYKRRTAINTVSFLEEVLERMPFPQYNVFKLIEDRSFLRILYKII